jgi:TPR repeat protein
MQASNYLYGNIMKKFSKLFLFLSLCLIVIFGFCACGNTIGDFRKNAEQGNAQAQFNLGWAYSTGKGAPKDDAEAVKWYRKAAEQGLANAQNNLGLAYFTGAGVTKDYAEAVKWYRKAAEQGLAQAQNNLGWAYFTGAGVTKDYAEAVKWYRKAAEQGLATNAQTQFNLGWAYYNGAGVTKDYAEAVKWYRKAAEQGLAQSQADLGVCYQNGTGVPKDHDQAVKWLRKAAEQGNAIGQGGLGVAYYYGTGVPQDYAEAIKWYRKAAEQGNATGQSGLGLAYYDGAGVPKDYDEAVKWYRKAAEQGYANAQNNLGWAYYNGTGVPKDYDEAVKWYRKAAEQGLSYAQANLATILKEIESARQTRAKAEEDSQKQFKPPDDLKGSGTGVFLTDDGLILTASHVVHDSTRVVVNTQQGLKTARVVKLDNANDLALLKCEGSFQAAQIKSSSGIKLGQSVFTIGFPNIQFQGFSPKMTKGEINSLSGFQDDPCHWQISVPVQPGNSGGPLFDEAGNVVGVVLAKLNAMKMAKITGDLPQNVNYAVKSSYVLPLLEPYRVNLAPASGVSSSPKKIEDVVEKVQKSVVLILVY